jgi:hypothetical protein
VSGLRWDIAFRLPLAVQVKPHALLASSFSIVAFLLPTPTRQASTPISDMTRQLCHPLRWRLKERQMMFLHSRGAICGKLNAPDFRRSGKSGKEGSENQQLSRWKRPRRLDTCIAASGGRPVINSTLAPVGAITKHAYGRGRRKTPASSFALPSFAISQTRHLRRPCWTERCCAAVPCSPGAR